MSTTKPSSSLQQYNHTKVKGDFGDKAYAAPERGTANMIDDKTKFLRSTSRADSKDNPPFKIQDVVTLPLIVHVLKGAIMSISWSTGN